MCGIAGIVGAGAAEKAARLGSAIELQSHRGPDDRAVVDLGSCVLAHNRLAIIDLPGGHQPMSTPDGRYHVVFNGEIYNYVELREELERRGHEFRTRSDTEVILHAYEEWGSACQEKLNGMWGFAIWDVQAQELFCSRDRFGVKPLLYAVTEDGFLFASESKTLLRMDPGLAEPAEPEIHRFLRTGLLLEGGNTFFRRVRQLEPGHCLSVSPGRRPVISRYYDLVRAIERQEVCEEPAERLRDLLEDSVRLRLRSDVPVGTCLSGGLDSSSIVALMSRLLGEPVHTFTSTYPGTGSDERHYVDRVVEAYGTVAHFIEPQMRDFSAVLPMLTWHQDAPSAAPGLYSQWHVMQLAHGKVTVLLDGQGGDEILGGYTGFYADYVAALLLDGNVRRLFAEWHDIREQTRAFPLALAIRPLMPAALRRMTRRLMRGTALMTREFARTWSASQPNPVVARALADRFNSSLYEALARTTLPALLHYEDRNSMAFSIEARTPFLDYRLVEYAMALPYAQKITGWRTKAPLRDAMVDVLPSEIVDRRDKMGFPTPFAEWLRSGLMSWVREVVLSPEARARQVTDLHAVAAMLAEHEAGRADRHWDIWRVLTLELWYRSFIDRLERVSA